MEVSLSADHHCFKVDSSAFFYIWYTSSNRMDSRERANSLTPAPRAVIFDLDDTLIISTVDFRKFRSCLIEYMNRKGAKTDRFEEGETTVSMIAEFEKEMRTKGIDERKIQHYMDEIETLLDNIELERIEETTQIPGADEILLILRENDIRIGVLTRGCTEYARRALEIAGLDELVDAVISRDNKSGIAPKPDPRSALLLTEMLGVEPRETVMIGDHSIDFACARDSGIRFFGIVSDERSRDDLRECGCQEIVSNLMDFLGRMGL